MCDTAAVRGRYERFAEQECRGSSELYFALASAVAGDEELLQFITAMPETQPNLFLAAVQYVTGPERMPQSAMGLRTVVDRSGDEIAGLMRTRRTQANEVGRCSVFLPALPTGPLALLEVGSSAGLCLLLDRFHYDYGGKQCGDDASPVRLRCLTNGHDFLSDALPEIAWRLGFDKSASDVRNDDDMRWLLSCVWADHAERRERLRQAIAIGRSEGLPVRRGDLVTDLAALIAEVPPDLPLVVFHSAVLAYISPTDRRTFSDTLTEASRQRPILWVSCEGATVVPEITALTPILPAVRPVPFLLGRTTLIDGRREDELLAFAHPHGAELTWLKA